MRPSFALFRSPVDLAHHYWKLLLQEGDWAIDATCGNGHDTLMLASMLKSNTPWGLIGLDIQSCAIQATQERLQLSLCQEDLRHIHLFCQSHTCFPPLAHQEKIKLIVYNLGYLPGGDHLLTTQTKNTLESIFQAAALLTDGGVLSITCYPGHPEGALEERALLQAFQQWDSSVWAVCHHTFSNRRTSPSLFLIQKGLVKK